MKKLSKKTIIRIETIEALVLEKLITKKQARDFFIKIK